MGVVKNKEKKKKAEVLIWDGSHLETLLGDYPVIVDQYWPEDPAILQPYQSHFAHQLSSDSKTPFNFVNWRELKDLGASFLNHFCLAKLDKNCHWHHYLCIDYPKSGDRPHIFCGSPSFCPI